jgi:hypothetical protein
VNDPAHRLDKPYLHVEPKHVPVKTRPSEPPAELPPLPTPPGYRGDPHAAVAIVGFSYGFSLEELQGSGRSRKLTECRMVAYWVLRTLLELSWGEVGKALLKDHSCAMHGVKSCCLRAAKDAEFGAFLEQLRTAVEARLAIGRKLG